MGHVNYPSYTVKFSNVKTAYDFTDQLIFLERSTVAVKVLLNGGFIWKLVGLNWP